MEGGERYEWKAAFFVYQCPKNKEAIENGANIEVQKHAVSLFFPAVRKRKTLVVDCNHQWTNPKSTKPWYRFYESQEHISQEQKGMVGGLFYVRTNHRSKVKQAADRLKRYCKEVFKLISFFNCPKKLSRAV